MLRQFSIRRIAGFFLYDWLSTLSLLLVAAWLRSWLGGLPLWFVKILKALQINASTAWSTSANNLDLPVLILVALLWPFFFIVFSVYDGRHNPTLKAELLNVFLAICVSTATLSGALYFSYRDTPRVLILIFFLLDLSVLLGSRVFFWFLRFTIGKRRGKQKRRVLVVGAGPVGRNATEQLKKFAWSELNIIGFLDDSPEKQGLEIDSIPVLGTLDESSSVVEANQIQEAVIALPLRAHERLVEICDQLQRLGVHVHVIPDLFALSFPNAALDGFGGIPVIDLGRPGIQGIRRYLKRAFDVIAVTTGLILLSPILLLVAFLVALDSPGPIIYRQKRIGENGRLFTMYKFRSMHVDSDPGIHKSHIARVIKENLTPEQLNAGNGGSLKLTNDPRITRLGRFLRKSSLDELPQLFNVLRGDMSLVGPRPSLPYEVELFQGWHKRRFEAPPGITGLWQVEGRNRVSFDEMVRMDLDYIEKQSLWLDLLIILKTPVALISADGAG